MEVPTLGVRRDALVDALRGACFAFMTVDHLPENPLSPFSNANYGPFGFFTAALGFVFLSGLVAGWAYEGRRERSGTRVMAVSAFRRVGVLYATQIILCVALAVAVALKLHGVERWNLEVFERSPWKGLFFSASLLYEPGYLGILPMYCLFLLLTPLLLWQFARGHVLLILCVSATLWMIAGFLITLPGDPNGVDFGAFNPLSYQFLFVLGLTFGTGALSVRQLSPRMQKRLFRAAAALAGMFFVLRQDYVLRGPLTPELDRVGVLFSAVQLGPLRLLNFAAFALLLFVLARRFDWDRVTVAGFRWLAFVGRNSLPVFAWSIMVTYIATALLPAGQSVALRILVVAAALASLTIPAWVRSRLRGRAAERPRGGAAPRGVRAPTSLRPTSDQEADALASRR